MRFKIGDQVVVTSAWSTLKGTIGEVIGRTKAYPNKDYYDVSFYTGIVTFEESCLDYPRELSLGEYRSDSISDQITSIEPKCDCGGFKTFGSMSEENHSNWCSSRQLKANISCAIKLPVAYPGHSFIIKGFKI